MTLPQVIQGTTDEIAMYLQRLKGRKNLLLVIPDEAVPTNELNTVVNRDLKQHFYLTATAEEFQRVFDALGKGKEHLPVLPPEAFERESLYEESF